MSTADVLKLDEYRDRRQHRIMRTRAFVATDPDRRALFGLLSEMAGLAGADRVGVVWVDEYGPEAAHPYFVVDFAVSPPRQDFSVAPLSKAWDAGVPGTLDETIGAGSTFAVALGSDGARGWFVVADSMTRRAPLSESIRERIMFLVGECSAVVLHKDIAASPSLMGGMGGSAFLRDLENRDEDDVARAMIERRFTVGRLGRLMVDEDLVVATSERRETVRRLRNELSAAGDLDPAEVGPYYDALHAFEHADVVALADAMLAIGSYAESNDHVYGALQAYASAFDLAGRFHEAEVAIQAARFSGRILRRRAEWQLADLWYGAALDIARLEELDSFASLALIGIAVIRRERGNFPGARSAVEEALAFARQSGETESIAAAHHTMMGVLQVMKEFNDALRNGWAAYHLYETTGNRTNCLTGIAALLKDMGDLDASEDAFIVVAHTAEEYYFRVYAYDALSHLAALRGDAQAFETRVEAIDALGWESGPLSAKAEIITHRGLSLQALGRLDEAEQWLIRAVDFSSRHKFSRSLFVAEAALKEVQLGKKTVRSDTYEEAALPDVREGIRRMREEVTAGAS